MMNMTTPDSANTVESFDVEKAIAEHLRNAPLYAELRYTYKTIIGRLPTTIHLFCQTCKAETIWETINTSGMDYRKGFFGKQYTCRNCKNDTSLFELYWKADDDGKTVFYKYGQYPELAERVPDELARELGRSSLLLYRKALTCRKSNLGLGALAYLRRVVHDQINSLLDIIAEEARRNGFAAEALTRIAQVKKDGRFSEKIEFASTILPPSLRPGGHNPIDQLHNITSEGLHNLEEDDCIAAFDETRAVFEYLFKEITSRRLHAENYAAKLAKIATSKKKEPVA